MWQHTYRNLVRTMSGHSKWAGIKHHKAAQDKKRSNLFTKLANNITIAARQGGGDISFNPSLRAAVDAGRAANMPKDNIDRAIKRGTGELGGAVVEELLYEGFGPANTAILVAVLTDNRNRSLADIRTIFTKNGGRFAEAGGVAYQFTERGVIRMTIAAKDNEKAEEILIESGAEDYQIYDDQIIVYTKPSDLHAVKEIITTAGLSVDSAAIERVPNTPQELTDEDLEKASAFVDKLEDYDDVTAVYTNIA
jgi:YebC/PmpR family DNA-binding regulatory protein